MRCARCGGELPKPPYFRLDTCPACLADLHACVQCEFYAPELNNGCRETQAERVVDKERSNFCDFYRAADCAGKPSDEKTAAMSALDKLFKK